MLTQSAPKATPYAPSVEVFDNVALIQATGQEPVGFHIQNLEVAGLTDEAAQTLHILRHSLHAVTAAQMDHEATEELKAWNDSKNTKVKPGKMKFGPRSITINVTQICNLHCTYCAAGGDGTFGDPVKKISVEKTLPQLKSFLDLVPEGRKFHITFLGGEPLLYPEGIRLLADYVRQMASEKSIRISFTVVTNGTRFTAENIQLLADLKANITVSIDGPAWVNDRTRPNLGARGVTESVIQGLQELLKRKSELGEVELSGVFGAQNMQLEAAYEFYSQFNVDHMDFTYDHLEISSDVNDQFIAAMIQVADRAYQAGGESLLRKIKTFDHLFGLLDSQQQVENYCGAGKSYFMIDARNTVYTCPWVAGQKDEVVGQGTHLWMDRLKPYETSLVELNKCQSCWARNLCGGGCMYIHKNRTGDKHLKDDNFCKRTRSLIAQAIVYYKEARTEKSAAERKEGKTI